MGSIPRTTPVPERGWLSFVGLFLMNLVIMLVLRLVANAIGWWRASLSEILVFAPLWAAMMVLADLLFYWLARRRARSAGVRHNGGHE
ncbi:MULTISPECIES: hypothetical protein [unclassified Luteococcus]|uniref:hypothetical protein n=1 Tax=unclassified Luteococcus TaxID=2639923 RepID=UPI00313EE0F4